MNNNTPVIIRSLIIYATIVPLAIWIGYLLAAPADRSTFGMGGILALILCAPLLLRWHHFLLIASWNLAMTIFFLPGAPKIWFLMTALSLGVSVLHRTINSNARFISAPPITWPLLFFLAVIIMTAKLTGGIGLHSMGSDVMGGRHYFDLIFAILGYFALTAMRIPPKRVGLCIGLFFLSGCSSLIGDLAPYLPSPLHFIFALFPVNFAAMEGNSATLDLHARYSGLGTLGMSGFLFMLSCYGPRGILLSGKPWRVGLLGLFGICMLFGGFRSTVILCGSIFTIQFFMERLHRTNVMPVFVFAGLIAVTLLVPFASHLPYTFQRSLAFLPLNLDPAARKAADDSSAWRLDLWRDTLPKVPQYLLLGKGYAISQSELASIQNRGFHNLSVAEGVDISNTYHSGPLSVVMPFGIWGVIALLWFWFACVRALYGNYRYGDPSFRTINIFLFAYFVAKIPSFLIIFGALEGDLAVFAVIMGLSISINGGIRRPVPVPVPVVNRPGKTPLTRPRLQPSFPH